MTMTLSKRDLLRAVAGIVALSAAGSAGAALLAPATGEVDAAGAAGIGRAWLALHPVKAKTLRAGLFPHGADETQLAHLADRIRRDFREGAIFTHKGWFLSETEARLCALISLT